MQPCCSRAWGFTATTPRPPHRSPFCLPPCSRLGCSDAPLARSAPPTRCLSCWALCASTRYCPSWRWSSQRSCTSPPPLPLGSSCWAAARVRAGSGLRGTGVPGHGAGAACLGLQFAAPLRSCPPRRAHRARRRRCLWAHAAPAGGQASNVATYVAHGDVALSVLMTAASTVAATVMTPTLTSLLAGAYIPVDGWVRAWGWRGGTACAASDLRRCRCARAARSSPHAARALCAGAVQVHGAACSSAHGAGAGRQRVL